MLLKLSDERDQEGAESLSLTSERKPPRDLQKRVRCPLEGLSLRPSSLFCDRLKLVAEPLVSDGSRRSGPIVLSPEAGQQPSSAEQRFLSETISDVQAVDVSCFP